MNAQTMNMPMPGGGITIDLSEILKKMVVNLKQEGPVSRLDVDKSRTPAPLAVTTASEKATAQDKEPEAPAPESPSTANSALAQMEKEAASAETIRSSKNQLELIWAWIKNLVSRIAAKLGYKAKLPEQLTDGQANGSEAITGELTPDPEGTGVKAVPPDAAVAAIKDEVDKLIAHILPPNSQIPGMGKENEAEVLCGHLKKLSDFSRVYEGKIKEQKVELNKWLQALAADLPGAVTPSALAQQLDGVGADKLFGAKASEYKALADGIKELEMASGRAKQAAVTLMEAVQRRAAKDKSPERMAISDKVAATFQQLFSVEKNETALAATDSESGSLAKYSSQSLVAKDANDPLGLEAPIDPVVKAEAEASPLAKPSAFAGLSRGRKFHQDQDGEGSETRTRAERQTA